MAIKPFFLPNLFNLSGPNLQLTYSTTGIDGKPHLHYQDSLHNMTFLGTDIRVVECDLGSVVSVTIQLTVDSGSTSFSVLIPRINLNSGETLHISTEGIATIHRFSIVPQLNHGQVDLYSVTPLRGTAQHVDF